MGMDYNSVISDISDLTAGRYDTDQTHISLELSAAHDACEVTINLLAHRIIRYKKPSREQASESCLSEPVGSRFSFVGRFSPIASRNASSEVYLVCKNKKPSQGGARSSPIAEIRSGLEELGVVQESGRVGGLSWVSGDT